MAKLWQTGSSSPDEIVQNYTASDDAVLDNNLVEMDLYVNAAHSIMLCESGYIKKNELEDILKVLKDIMKEYRNGKFHVSPEDEDVHTKIENTVTDRIGSAGGKIHTGRSRNDQVLTDLRLFEKFSLIELIKSSLKLAGTIKGFSEKNMDIPMPGYTHMQRAMPSSAALWGGAFAESLIDDAGFLFNVLDYIDSSPLGSGAGYGINLSIDRNRTRDLLGFSRIQVNPIYCQNSRGKFEAMVLSGLSNIMLTIGRLANDILLFTTAEFDFFSINSKFTTGSSIMPQKKNLDIMELLRARVRTVHSCESLVKSITASIPSGYSRDLQETKKPVIEAFNITRDSLEIMTALFSGLTINRENALKAMSDDLFATDAVFKLVEDGIPFREAYRKVKDTLKEVSSSKQDHIKLSNDATIGTPANPGLKTLNHALDNLTSKIDTLEKALKSGLESLLNSN
ncbi:MAG: argininosuccinate lyase [Spirochaetes bacterium]|nr:argininosuccinate lyase [Spirochaetota bacterium]